MKVSEHLRQAADSHGNLKSAIQHLQKAAAETDTKAAVARMGMAINYIAVELKSLKLKKEASAIMKVSAELAEGNTSVALE